MGMRAQREGQSQLAPWNAPVWMDGVWMPRGFFSLVRGPVLTTLVTTVRTYFILFLGLALLSRATFFPLTFDSDHPDVHVYAHLPTSAFFLGEILPKATK